MSNLISRDDAVKAIMSEPMNEPKYPIWFANKIKALPSATISFDFSKLSSGQLYDIRRLKANASADRLKGQWEYCEHAGISDVWKCNQCGEWMFGKTNFCPFCGADMRSEDDD